MPVNRPRNAGRVVERPSVSRLLGHEDDPPSARPLAVGNLVSGCKISGSDGSVDVSLDCEEADIATKSTDFSAVFGAGVDIPTNGILITGDVRYDLGLSNIDASGADGSVKNRSWGIFLGAAVPSVRSPPTEPAVPDRPRARRRSGGLVLRHAERFPTPNMPKKYRLAPGRVFLVGAVLAPIMSAGCASAGATYGSGVGDKLLNHPPYYAGKRSDAPGAVTAAGHLPIVYQRGANQAPIFDPEASPAVRALLDQMNAYLDSLGVSTRLAEGGAVSAVTHAATRRPPDVQFNCLTETGFHDDDCAVGGDTVLGRGTQTMRLAVGRPSTEWVGWTAEIMDGAGVEHVLVITLEVGNYFVRQRGITGKKEVELGTDHVESIPGLTSLETPVSAVQLTGVLADREGKAIRIGAEGLLARRTDLAISALGGQALITDADVQALMSARREELPGQPSTWRVGLHTLVTRLLGGW